MLEQLTADQVGVGTVKGAVTVNGIGNFGWFTLLGQSLVVVVGTIVGWYCNRSRWSVPELSADIGVVTVAGVETVVRDGK